MTVAGHELAETHRGRACLTCGRKWVDIRNVTPADLHQPHLAHQGNLTSYELEQIIAERTAEDARIAQATRTAAGFGIGGMAEGSEIEVL